MRRPLALLLLCACGSSAGRADGGGPTADAAPLPDAPPPESGTIQVVERGGDPGHTGGYIDAAFTRAAVAGLHRDPSFAVAIDGPVYAQLLYIADGPGHQAAILAATEKNVVSAFAVDGGARLWTRTLGPPATSSDLPCGNISPLGITGTPVVDPAGRTVYVDGMLRDGAKQVHHSIWALDLDDGSPRGGWPVNANDLRAGSLAFDSSVQNQRGALTFVAGKVYVPYGGHWGDCGSFHGWVIGVPAGDPAGATGWATRARGGGSWAPGGIATDGEHLFITTGNTFGAQSWADGEAIIKLGLGPTYSAAAADYFAPSNWKDLDNGDIDIGGTAPIFIDVPGASPSRLTLALGKDGKAYLASRDDLGGVGGELQQLKVSGSAIITSAATYTTTAGTFVVFTATGSACPSGQSGNLIALKVSAESPPRMSVAWCAKYSGRSPPIASSSDGRHDAVVWTVGAEGDGKLHGFDGETGQVVYTGTDTLAGVHRFHPAIVVHGRLYVAGSTALYAFVP